MVLRTRRTGGFIEPCLPSSAKAPLSGPEWLHEIKHDGFRLMARRDGAGVRLITARAMNSSQTVRMVAGYREEAGALRLAM